MQDNVGKLPYVVYKRGETEEKQSASASLYGILSERGGRVADATGREEFERTYESLSDAKPMRPNTVTTCGISFAGRLPPPTPYGTRFATGGFRHDSSALPRSRANVEII